MAKSEIPSRKVGSTNFWRELLAWLGFTLAAIGLSGGAIAFIAWVVWSQLAYGSPSPRLGD